MIAPLRYVVSLSKKSKMTIITIAIVMMFVTSIFIIVYSYEVSNESLAERFESKYYIISSDRDITKSDVGGLNVYGAYVWISRGSLDGNETYILSIYDPHSILGSSYQCPTDGIVLGTLYKYKPHENLLMGGREYTLNTTRVFDFRFFPNYWVIVNRTLFNGKNPNFIITTKDISVDGYTTQKMVTLGVFYSHAAEEVSFDLMIIDLISVVVVYLFINALLGMEIRENTKKISIIRAIGSSRFNIGSIYLLRSLFIGLAGMVTGFSLGVILSYLLITMIPAMGMLTYFYVFVPFMVVYVDIIVALLGAILASINPIRKAINMDIIRGMREASL